MRILICVLLSLLILCESASKPQGGKKKKDVAPPSTLTPEQQEDFAKCKLCEKVMDDLHVKMDTTSLGAEVRGHRLDKHNKHVKMEDARAAVRAIEILETLCRPSLQTPYNPEMALCEAVVAEHEEELEAYIRAGVERKEVKDRICRSRCPIQTELQDMVQRMKSSLPTAKNLTVWDEVEMAFVLMKTYWKWWALATAVLTVLSLAITFEWERRRLKTD